MGKEVVLELAERIPESPGRAGSAFDQRRVVLRAVSDLGVAVETRQETRFYPWSTIRSIYVTHQ